MYPSASKLEVDILSSFLQVFDWLTLMVGPQDVLNGVAHAEIKMLRDVDNFDTVRQPCVMAWMIDRRIVWL
jgi:hypothetical protein